MAGSRHHEVPRFLMKGFASRVIPKKKEDAVFVWVYRKDSEPFECNTVNVGVESKFYKHGELNVDDEITELEKTFAPCVSRVREADDGSKVLDPTFLEFIVHLTRRTKHMRDSLTEMGEFAVDTILGHFSDDQNVRAYLIRLITHRREYLMKLFDEELKKVSTSRFKKALARTIVRYAPAEFLITFLDSQGPELSQTIKSVNMQLAQGLNQLVKQAHIKALVKNLVPEPRVEYYKQLYWYVRKSTEPLILGDVCCLFQTSNSRYLSLAGPSDGVQKVYLPVSKDCIVIGNLKDQLPNFGVSEINEVSAKVSRNYFISSESSPDMAKLSRLLGTEAYILTEAEMEESLTVAMFESVS